MYLNLKSDPVSSFPNPHSIPKVPMSVSTAHICRLTDIITVYSIRTDDKYMRKKKVLPDHK